MIYRGFVVWGVAIFLIMGVFMIFVLAGWPGSPSDCTKIVNGHDSCYCEAYNLADVQRHARGVRQPVNTWFNLYSIVTSLVVAGFVAKDRRRYYGDGGYGGTGTSNTLRTTNPIADLYIFAVLFLGLGSMWFHASLSSAVSWMDSFSMYVFAVFLVFYAVHRVWDSDKFFWPAYLLTVALFTVVGSLWQANYASPLLIGILVAAYLVFEFIWVGTTGAWNEGQPDRTKRIVLWSCAAGAMGLAILFWALSQSGKPLCDSHSLFQPHGLLWHPLAGAMALLLYFYWRTDDSVEVPGAA